MPKFEFRCSQHGAFDGHYSFSEGVPSSAACRCGELSPRVLTPPATVLVRGGTGARRGHAVARKESAWNEKASDLQRDPYTQAKAQIEGMSRKAAEYGKSPPKISEESIQAGAAAIQEVKEKPKATVVQKQVAIANRKRTALRRQND